MPLQGLAGIELVVVDLVVPQVANKGIGFQVAFTDQGLDARCIENVIQGKPGEGTSGPLLTDGILSGCLRLPATERVEKVFLDLRGNRCWSGCHRTRSKYEI